MADEKKRRTKSIPNEPNSPEAFPKYTAAAVQAAPVFLDREACGMVRKGMHFGTFVSVMVMVVLSLLVSGCGDQGPTSTPTPTPTLAPTETPEFMLQIADNTALVGHGWVRASILDKNGWSLSSEVILDVAADDQGRIGVVRSEGLSVLDGQTWTHYPRSTFASEQISAIALGPGGEVVVGCYEGVSVFDGERWANYGWNEFGLGEEGKLIEDVAVDQRGRVWLSTTNGGISAYDGDQWTPYDESSGLASNHVPVLAVDLEGRIWAGHTYGVSVFDGSRWTNYGAYEWAADVQVEDLFQVNALTVDREGRIWAGTFRDGLFMFDGTTWRVYNRSNAPLTGLAVKSLACDSQGRIWIGTDWGVSILDGQTWTRYTEATSGLVSNRVTAIAVRGAGPALPPPTEPRLGAVGGVVVRDGHPVEGVLVQISWSVSWPNFVGESPSEGEIYIGTTDESGHFLIQNVPIGSYEMAYRSPEREWFAHKDPKGYGLMSVPVLEGQTTDLGRLETKSEE